MSSQTAATAIVGGMYGACAVAIIAIYILTVIGSWKIFNKMGEPGWKSLIPIYNEYILFKHCWSTKMFWIMVALVVVSSILSSLGGGNVITYVTKTAAVSYSVPSPLSICGLFVLIAAYVISTLGYYFVGKSFGHGVPFFVFSFFLPPIALMYLGFSKDEYQGNTTA